MCTCMYMYIIQLLYMYNIHIVLHKWMLIQMHVHVYSMKQIREQVKKEDVDVKSKSSHHSQTDAAKGFGGKYGVSNERQDKVWTWWHVQILLGYDGTCTFVSIPGWKGASNSS